MRLVLDTNVAVSALLWRGTPRLLIKSARERQIELFTSISLLAELTDVLWRKKFEKKIAASLFTIDDIVDRYAALARLVRPESIPPTSYDPDDRNCDRRGCGYQVKDVYRLFVTLSDVSFRTMIEGCFPRLSAI